MSRVDIPRKRKIFSSVIYKGVGVPVTGKFLIGNFPLARYFPIRNFPENLTPATFLTLPPPQLP